MMELAVWTEPLAESNCYLLAEDSACLVIDPNDPRGPLELLQAKGWTPEAILLTHEHCDHMAGLETLRERWPAARVVASAACSEGIQSKRINMSSMMEAYLTFHGKPGVTYPPFVCRPVDETYDTPYDYRWRGHMLHCVPAPGHTPGSALLFLDGDALFSGDYLLPDEETVLRLPGGNPAQFEAETRPLLEALPRGLRVYPGHGGSYVL